jgi:hypothetical protein
MSDDSGEVRPWNLIDGSPRVTRNVARERFNICRECPELIKPINVCGKCGCMMKLKTKLADATCPLGKW